MSRVGVWIEQGIASKQVSSTHFRRLCKGGGWIFCGFVSTGCVKTMFSSNSRYVWFGKFGQSGAGKKRRVGGVGFLVDAQVVDIGSIVHCEELPILLGIRG